MCSMIFLLPQFDSLCAQRPCLNIFAEAFGECEREDFVDALVDRKYNSYS